MAELYFTVARNLVGDYTEKPNAFLFGTRKKPSDVLLREIFEDKELRSFLPEGKPVMAIRCYKAVDGTAPGFLAEWRVVLTTLSDFAYTISPDNDHVTILAEEPTNVETPITFRNYKDLLINCSRLERTIGCEKCPLMGLECVKENMGYQPWYMHLSYSRHSDPWAAGMTAEGGIVDRQTTNAEHHFRGKNIEELLKVCSKLTPLGAEWKSPMDTKIDDSQKMGSPIRPVRDHRFFVDPEYHPTSTTP